jgi:hypothetical protein
MMRQIKGGMVVVEHDAPSTCTASKEVIMLQAKYSVRVLADERGEEKETREGKERGQELAWSE